MSKKIYLSPSSQPANMYVVGNISEQESCRKIAAELKNELDKCGFTTYAGMSGTMYTRTAESNKNNVDLHLPIHTNACNGVVSGLRIMVSKKGGEAEKIAKAIMKTLAPITPGTSDGISVMSNLYEIKATKAICVYLEVGFHDNAKEAQWIIDHPKEIAAAIAEGLCNHYGVKYKGNDSAGDAEKKENSSTNTDNGTIYRVQTGAFKVKTYADNLYNKLKAEGFSVYLVQSDGYYKVQVGAFKNKTYATNMLNKLKAAGYDAIITTKGK